MTERPAARKTIFIAHPSDLLTDHVANGDGLVAYGFLHELARRGYRLHIAAPRTALLHPLPGDATIHTIPPRFANKALSRLHYMWAIRRLLWRLKRQERIDLVHQLNPVFVGLSLGLLGCRLPIVLGTFVARWPVVEATEAPRGRLSTALRHVLRWSINLAQQAQATRLLLTTPAALNRIASPRLSRHKIAELTHGIDETLFSPAPAVPTQNGPTILFYSHLEERKGVFVLVEAFGAVLRQIPDCRLVLVGRGEQEAELRRQIATLAYADRIDLPGPLPRHEAPALMRAHSLYCLPSFGEPFGMTALEAMACGLPLVVTDGGGLGHLVPSAGGLHVPARDPAALAAALVALLRDPEKRRRMGEANRAHVERHHTWSAVGDRLEAIYVGLPEAKARPAALGVADPAGAA